MDKKQGTLIAGAAGIAALAGIFWWTAGSDPATQSPTVEASSPNAKPGILAVAGNKAHELGITLAPAQVASEAPLADLPAMIAPPPNARVAVPATLPGVVMRTLVVEGDAVRQGQPLAVVASRDVLTLGADLSRAGARLGVAQSSAARLSQLSREGIIAGARADEARALAAEARADVSEKSRILRMVGGHGGSGTYTLTAPIAGRVSKADIQAGAPVDGTTAPYVIDAVGRYEVTAQVPERLVGTIRPGMTVKLGDLSGTVTAVGSVIDPMTRSATLKANLPAGPGIVAGRASSLAVFGPAPAGSVLVPSSAIASLEGQDVVFVAVQGGFSARNVTLGGASGGQTLVLAGVRSGERVVVSGTSALKALALSK